MANEVTVTNNSSLAGIFPNLALSVESSVAAVWKLKYSKAKILKQKFAKRILTDHDARAKRSNVETIKGSTSTTDSKLNLITIPQYILDEAIAKPDQFQWELAEARCELLKEKKEQETYTDQIIVDHSWRKQSQIVQGQM